MLKNAYSLAKIGADTAENERNFAEILPKIGLRAARAPEPGPPSGRGTLGGDPGSGVRRDARRRRRGPLLLLWTSYDSREIKLATASLLHLSLICPFLPLIFFSFSEKLGKV